MRTDSLSVCGYFRDSGDFPWNILLSGGLLKSFTQTQVILSPLNNTGLSKPPSPVIRFWEVKEADRHKLDKRELHVLLSLLLFNSLLFFVADLKKCRALRFPLTFFKGCCERIVIICFKFRLRFHKINVTNRQTRSTQIKRTYYHQVTANCLLLCIRIGRLP